MTDDRSPDPCTDRFMHGTTARCRSCGWVDPRSPGSGFSIGDEGCWPGLAKLIEECGEVQQVAGKIIATGGIRAHWDGSDLHERLARELADLLAAITYVRAHNGLAPDEGDGWQLDARCAEKVALFEQWHVEATSR